MKRKYYVGFQHGTRDAVFTAPADPTFGSHGHIYFGVMGPFRTKRAAQFTADCGRNNPHIQHVDDAERIARKAVRS